MDKRELMQISSIMKEIEILKKDLCYAEYLVKPDVATDSVKGSSSHFPYTQRTFLIRGIDYDGYDRKVRKLRNQLERRIEELMDKVEEANEYIDAIEDSETRMILQCRYINNMTWEQIENETGISMSTAKRRFRKWRDFDLA